LPNNDADNNLARTSKRNPELWDLKLVRGKGGRLIVTASRVERGWRMGSRWVGPCLHAVHVDEPHRCSIKLKGKWVKKWWVQGQPWHKGTSECGPGGGGACGGNEEGSNRGSE
jgi:hypothetical protein